jgi:hypothetical protein
MMQVRCVYFGRRKAELQAQIDYGHHFPAQVDDPLYVAGRLRYCGNFLDSHDFPHFEHTNAELLVSEVEREIFSGSCVRGCGNLFARSEGGCHIFSCFR